MTVTLDFAGQILETLSLIIGIRGWIDMEPKGCESIWCWTQVVTLNFGLTHDLDLVFSRSNFKYGCHIFRKVEWQRCELDTQWASSWATVWQIHWPSNGSMWNCYSFQPVGPWKGYPFTDLGSRGVVILWMPCPLCGSICLSDWPLAAEGCRNDLILNSNCFHFVRALFMFLCYFSDNKAHPLWPGELLDCFTLLR